MPVWKKLRPILSRFVRFMHIAYLERKSDYKGTYLGIFWLPLSTLIFTAMLGLVFHHSDTLLPQHFFLYVLSGYVLWSFIAASVTDSIDLLQKRLDFAVHNNLSVGGLFGKALIDRLFDFLINLALLVLAVAIFAPAGLLTAAVLILPLLGILMVTSLALSYLVNILTVFFPDLVTLIRTGVRFVFFASPIFWSARGDTSGIREALVAINPAAYFLHLSRQTFGIEPLEPVSWLVAAGITAALCLGSALAYRATKGLVRNIK